MCVNTRERSQAPEIMDDFNIGGDLLKETLHQITQVNQLLGGNQITLKGVAILLKNIPVDQEIKILDVGCGNGAILRKLADFAKKKHRTFILTGVDANRSAVTHARELSQQYPNIHYYHQNIMESSFGNTKYDVIICTLTLHHFKDKAIYHLLKIFQNMATIGIVINDLHRSRVAYRLYQFFCFVFGFNSLMKRDGLQSILRGFKKKELQHFATTLNIAH